MTVALRFSHHPAAGGALPAAALCTERAPPTARPIKELVARELPTVVSISILRAPWVRRPGPLSLQHGRLRRAFRAASPARGAAFSAPASSSIRAASS